MFYSHCHSPSPTLSLSPALILREQYLTPPPLLKPPIFPLFSFSTDDLALYFSKKVEAVRWKFHHLPTTNRPHLCLHSLFTSLVQCSILPPIKDLPLGLWIHFPHILSRPWLPQLSTPSLLHIHIILSTWSCLCANKPLSLTPDLPSSYCPIYLLPRSPNFSQGLSVHTHHLHTLASHSLFHPLCWAFAPITPSKPFLSMLPIPGTFL